MFPLLRKVFFLSFDLAAPSGIVLGITCFRKLPVILLSVLRASSAYYLYFLCFSIISSSLFLAAGSGQQSCSCLSLYLQYTVIPLIELQVLYMSHYGVINKALGRRARAFNTFGSVSGLLCNY